MEKEYFSHDYTARSDKKMKPLLARHGYLGYGVFWAIIEDLYSNANALHTDYDTIAFDLRADVEMVKSIINDFNLFVVDGDIFWSESVARRLNKRNEKSIKARESAEARWAKYKGNANAEQTLSDSNAIKEKKRIVKNNKDKDEGIENAPSEPPLPPAPLSEMEESFKKFQAWLQVEAKEVSKMKEPFTVQQFEKLKKSCTTEEIMALCLNMHNWKDLNKKRTSAYATFLNWHNRDGKK